ncbi:hypothetical protein ACFIOY_39330 [Bradyrhizobium sp. TZ2]
MPASTVLPITLYCAQVKHELSSIRSRQIDALKFALAEPRTVSHQS